MKAFDPNNPGELLIILMERVFRTANKHHYWVHWTRLEYIARRLRQIYNLRSGITDEEVLRAIEDDKETVMPLDTQHFHGHPRYLSVYVTTRHYGGPEEGGWWYNWHRLVFTTPNPISVRKLNATRMRMFRRFSSLKQGDIYSVLGGEDFDIVAERTPGTHATKGRPHYC